MTRRAALIAVLVAAVAWHALAVLIDGWLPLAKEAHGRDFASYYYAAVVASEGGDPYDKEALAAAARRDGSRREVHPYFYPPPFLLIVAWAPALDLVSAWRAWFWLDELALWVAALALWRWWRPLGDGVAVVIAVAVATLSAIPDNHLMGQANLPVLAIAIVGLWQADRRPVLGGALVGVACMLKMSPALFVAWWLVHRRIVPAAAAIVTAIGLTLVSFALVPPDIQWRFYTEVLPTFGSGLYNGLDVPITIFGNHSIPNLWQQAFPSSGPGLSATARILSAASLVAVSGATLWALRARPADGFAAAGQVAAIGVTLLLVPVFTYEHHVVWALPAVVISALGLWHGRLDPRFAIPLGLAFALTAWDLSELKQLWSALRSWPALAEVIQEAKFAALCVWWVAAVAVGRSRPAGGER